MNDANLIDKLGGPAKLAGLLGYKKGGIQRVHNWRKRGIPSKVKLNHPEIFRKFEVSRGERPTRRVAAVVKKGA